MIKRTETIFPKSKVKKRRTMTEVRASQVSQWQKNPPANAGDAGHMDSILFWM